MRIAEIFRSLQGEGRLTGVESVFIRASGCNLRCRFCDTEYASWSANGSEMSVQEILEAIDLCTASEPPEHIKSLAPRPSPLLPTSRHAIITGGEPMLFAEVVPLTRALRQSGWHVTIETNGTRHLPVACDLLSISPKLSNTTPLPQCSGSWHVRHELDRHAPAVVQRLVDEYECQVKFVIDAPEDCPEVERYLAEAPWMDRRRVLLMPQGTDPRELAQRARWLEPYCRRSGFTFCPRRQIEWFGPGRGK